MNLDNYSSFSEIVNQIQGDKQKGARAIVELNCFEQNLRNQIDKLTDQLERLRVQGKVANDAILNIQKHVELKLPVFIQHLGNSYIIEEDLSIRKLNLVE